MAILRAITAAELTFKGNTTVDEAAKEFNISRGSVRDARLILNYGSSADIDAAKAGSGLVPLSKKIRKNLTPSQIEELKRRSGTITDKRRENIQTNAAIWSKFRPMLSGLTQLPSPEDMVKLVASNSSREATVNNHLNAATKWLEEFNNAWTEFHRNKYDNNRNTNS